MWSNSFISFFALASGYIYVYRLAWLTACCDLRLCSPQMEYYMSSWLPYVGPLLLPSAIPIMTTFPGTITAFRRQC